MISLSEEQEQGLQMMKDCIASDKQISSLIYGSAGTGKSLLINHLVAHLEENNIPYCLCAPTHKAALVMEKYTKREAMTLHKLLNLSPNIQIFELDLRRLLFFTSKSSMNFPYKGVVVCDEASMINDDLYELLLTRAKEYEFHICFFGDFKQLSPVQQDSLSKIIHTQPQLELTKIYRQANDSELLPILGTLRTRPIRKFEPNNNLKVAKDFKDFIANAKNLTTKAIESRDILQVKMAAYTNARVDAYNKLLHNLLFGESPYYKHEFLTCHDNLEFGGVKFYNSMDYVITEEPKETSIIIPKLPIKTLPGWKVTLYDSLSKSCSFVSIISPDLDCKSRAILAETIESIRLTAIEVGKISKLKSKQYWKDYYQMINSFTTPFDIFFDNRLIRKRSFSYGYASTIHKLQGSNYDNILVDIRDVINKCHDKETLRQLEYVALSRTRNNALILQ